MNMGVQETDPWENLNNNFVSLLYVGYIYCKFYPKDASLTNPLAFFFAELSMPISN